jgi:hypothetical protein
MLSAKEIETALDTGHELRALEVKGPLPATDPRFFAKVTRAALSMGNLRDGGHVVIGIADDDLGAMLPGLSPDDLATWVAFDDVSQRMAEYTDPPLRLHIEEFSLSTGAVVAVIEVGEFVDTPHLCASDYSGVLRRGAVYVRSLKMPQTAEIASSAEMRALLDLATQKALRSYVETAERAGVHLQGSAGTALSDDELFKRERERGWDE